MLPRLLLLTLISTVCSSPVPSNVLNAQTPSSAVQQAYVSRSTATGEAAAAKRSASLRPKVGRMPPLIKPPRGAPPAAQGSGSACESDGDDSDGQGAPQGGGGVQKKTVSARAAEILRGLRGLEASFTRK